MMDGLQEIQQQIGTWSKELFGNNVSLVTGHPMYSQNALTGLVEEVGELNHVTICHHQGRRGYDDEAKYKADRDDALADILVFLCDYACREGVDLLTVLNSAWTKVVSKRNLQNWSTVNHERPAETKEIVNPIERQQTGQGWAEPIEDPLMAEKHSNNYDRTCFVCKIKKVHNSSASGMCPDCYANPQNRGKKPPVEVKHG